MATRAVTALCLFTLAHLCLFAKAEICQEGASILDGVAIINGDCGDVCATFGDACPGYACSCVANYRDLCVVNVERLHRVKYAFCGVQIMTEEEAMETLYLDAAETANFFPLFAEAPWPEPCTQISNLLLWPFWAPSTPCAPSPAAAVTDSIESANDLN